MIFTISADTPASKLGYGYVPMHLRSQIISTPATGRMIRKLAARGPAKMGRNNIKVKTKNGKTAINTGTNRRVGQAL